MLLCGLKSVNGKVTIEQVKIAKFQEDMKQEQNTQLYKKLERARYLNRELDCWSGRMLQQVLGYRDWHSFLKVVEKAKVLCKESGFPVRDHFSFGSRKMTIGKGGFGK